MSELIILQAIIERSLIFALLVMAMYISSRVIKFDDLTIEGSFGLGGALTAYLLFYQVPAVLVLILSVAVGALCGMATALLYTRLKLNNLISGIVVTTALFSICLKVGGAHASIIKASTIFALTPRFPIILLTFLVAAMLAIIGWMLKTEVGYLLQAVGDNPLMLRMIGKSPERYQSFGLMIANGLTGLAGSIFVQYFGYFSIQGNVGILVIALAGLIMSEVIKKGFGFQLIVGAFLYQLVIALTYELNIDQEFTKLLTALLIVGVVGAKQIWRK